MPVFCLVWALLSPQVVVPEAVGIDLGEKGGGHCGAHGNYAGGSCPSCVREENAPAPQADPVAEEARRLAAAATAYRKTLAVLQAHRVLSRAAAQAGAPAPGSLAQLSARLDRLYVDAATWKRLLQEEHDFNRNGERGYVDVARQFADAEAGYRKETEAAVARRAAAEAELPVKAALADAQEKRARVWHNNEEVLKEPLFERIDKVRGLLVPLLPVDERKALRAGLAKRAWPAGHDPVAATPNPGPSATTPVELARGEQLKVKAPGRAPGDSVEKKQEALDALAASLDQLRPAVLAQRQALAPARQNLLRARAGMDAEIDRMKAAEDAAKAAVVAVKSAERRAKEAVENQRRSASNALKLAAASLVWDEIHDRVVLPRVEEFLEANGLLGGLKAVEAMKKIHENPESLIPDKGVFKGMPRVIETARKVAALEEHWEGWMTAAIAELGSGKSVVDPALARRLFFSTDREAVEVAKTAAGQNGGTLGKLMTILVEKAPRE